MCPAGVMTWLQQFEHAGLLFNFSNTGARTQDWGELRVFYGEEQKLALEAQQEEGRSCSCRGQDEGAVVQEPMKVNEVHQQPKEKVAKKFPCVVCKQEFVKKNSLKEHVRRVHLAAVVRCEQCGARVREDRQERHRQMHRAPRRKNPSILKTSQLSS